MTYNWTRLSDNPSEGLAAPAGSWQLMACRGAGGLSLWSGFVDTHLWPDFGLQVGDDLSGGIEVDVIGYTAYPDLPGFLSPTQLSETSREAFGERVAAGDGQWINVTAGGPAIRKEGLEYFGLQQSRHGLVLVEVDWHGNRPVALPGPVLADRLATGDLVAIHPLPILDELKALAAVPDHAAA